MGNTVVNVGCLFAETHPCARAQGVYHWCPGIEVRRSGPLSSDNWDPVVAPTPSTPMAHVTPAADLYGIGSMLPSRAIPYRRRRRQIRPSPFLIFFRSSGGPDRRLRCRYIGSLAQSGICCWGSRLASMSSLYPAWAHVPDCIISERVDRMPFISCVARRRMARGGYFGPSG